MQKSLVMIIGAGSVGKSTLTRAICGEGGEAHAVVLRCEEHKSNRKVSETVTYTLFPSGLAIAGNLRNGSDSISLMDGLRQTVELCWRSRDVVIVDTVRATHKFVRWIHDHPLRPATLFVFLNPSLDMNLARLRERRRQRGIAEMELPPRTFWNVLTFRARARSVWKYARTHYRRQPVRFLEIVDGTPEQAAKRIVEVLRELKNNDHETC